MPGTGFLSTNIDCISSIKNDARNTLQKSLFDCHKNIQPITIYRSPLNEITVIDPSYDTNWGRGPTPEINKTYTAETLIMPAIIIYNSPQDLQRIAQDEKQLAHIKMLSTPQTVRLKFKTVIDELTFDTVGENELARITALSPEVQVEEILKEIAKAEKITFANNIYSIQSDIKKTMFFGEPIWLEIVLQRED
jgi:hypothetical protein